MTLTPMDISANAFMDETQAMHAMLPTLAPLAAQDEVIYTRTKDYIDQIRATPPGASVESFLSEYGLNTKEGVALMCLAEALLRIPDPAVAHALIRDKLTDAQFTDHLGQSDSFFVNASSWGLWLTGSVVRFSGMDGRPEHMLGKLTRKMGDPVIREALKTAMHHIGGQFVLGETIESAIKHAGKYARQGYRFSYDMLGEGARTETQAKEYLASYLHAIEKVGKGADPKAPLLERSGISIKLTALHPRYSWGQRDRVMAELLPRVEEIILAARKANIAVAIDAEESTRLDIEMDLFEALATGEAAKGWEGLGFVVQAYQKRAFALIDWLADLAKTRGVAMPVRLVKGAYWDSEIKWAQAGGLPGYPVFTRKCHTDVSFLACAEKMLAAGGIFFGQFATHNARSVASIEAIAERHGVAPGAYEFQRLHGMGEGLHDAILARHASRVYAPVGPHKDLLAYLIRRLLENGANSSFVHLLMDEETPSETLAGSSMTEAEKTGYTPNPDIPLPAGLYGIARPNPEGVDTGNRAQMEALEAEMAPHRDAARALAAPARISGEAIGALMDKASAAFTSWSTTPVATRAMALRRAADELMLRRSEVLALLCVEGGKTLSDGVAELREAVDFCRYYAHSAESLMAMPTALPGPTGESNQLSLHPRGVFFAVAPWNFPLAIFTGQVVAALAAGNTVIAKPAGQTPRIAALMLEILHESGVPEEAALLAHGSGAEIGGVVLSDPRLAGVVFTGSTTTALGINRALAAKDGPITPLIAETGGQNAMVVDSSALLEHAVDDIIHSAFGSAGQRCSALRVLCVQDDIADELMAMLAGAMQDLRMGDPAKLSTDIGPVIDASAKRELEAHIARMQSEARLVAATPVPDDLPDMTFVAPHAFEIPSIDTLTDEVFGPVLHIMRYKAGHEAKLAAAINATGFGLTFGLHSRITTQNDFFTQHVHAGNYYINRSMTGAVVGVQPFGGEGLSGTGPKAGGPHYLLRFMTERVVTVNTAAIGGNLTLLAGE